MSNYPVGIDNVRKVLISLKYALKDRPEAGGVYMALNALEGMTQLDAVEVVRCRECKFAEKTIWSSGEMYCPIWKMNPRPDGYCYLGEKMDATDNNVGHKDGGAEG